ncbi:MAG: FAD-dependent oxidoreductase [Ktedonobacteraceae bacterium]|nr:FAD-dependent oxidoreductase [Ktedonobacteraceae bacterium]
MAEQITYLIIGNGIAGVTAAEILRAEDAAATIAVIADDPFPVYYRPALKDYLAGRVREDKLWARPSSFYQNHNIYFLPERVVSIQPGQHFVQLHSGKKVSYRNLLLASGARPATLHCPGLDLQGVTTLRTVADYQAVQEQLKQVRRVVVTGSGTLALETIETLRHRGYEVVHLIRKRTLWSEVLDATASDLVLLQEQRDGVDVRLESEIAEVIGRHGRVSGVVTSQGERIACEMVIIAIGIEPNIDFIKDSGIACGRGVRVDRAMRTNAPDVYAAGDVLEITDTLSRRTRVLGQWFPAIQQARAAAYSMLGALDLDRPFSSSTFYNATFLYGLDFASVGLTGEAAARGYQEITADPRPRTYRKVVLNQGIPVGMLSLGDRKGALAFKRAIDHRVNLLPVASRLFADDFSLAAWLDQQGVPPPILSVSRLDEKRESGTAKSAYAGSGTGASDEIAGTDVVPAVRADRPAERKPVEAAPVAPVAPAAAVVGKEPPPGETQFATTETALKLSQPAQSLDGVLVHEPDRVTGLHFRDLRLSKTDVTVVGRQPGVHLLIDQGTVSRRHAEISYVNGQYVLRDLNSTNGTFVNDVRLPSTSTSVLKANDLVRFGTLVKFRFVLRPATGQTSGRRRLSSSPSMAGIARSQALAVEQKPAQVGQPVLNQDGSLLLPGAANPILAPVVATFERSPALVVLSGQPSSDGRRTPQVFLLQQARRMTLGRDRQNDIMLADVVVSRRHAEIFPGPEGFYVRDLGSSNGTIVNQTSISNPYLLTHGDRIMLGGSVIFFIDLRSKWVQTERVQAQSATHATQGMQRDAGSAYASSITKKEQAPAISVQAPAGSGELRREQPLRTGSPPAAQQGTPAPRMVICTRCGMANMPVARFCAGCSAPLHAGIR